MSLSAIQSAAAPRLQNVPHVTIPAPPETAMSASATDTRIGSATRSAKGEWRSDAAAPPTAAQASDSFGFGDLLDIINPLQHIPGVSWVYQHLTGDSIKPAENVAGGFLYGGPLGGMLALAMSSWQELDAASPATIETAVTNRQGGKFGGAAMPTTILATTFA